MIKLGIVLNTARKGIADELIEKGFVPVLIYDSANSKEVVLKSTEISKYALVIPFNYANSSKDLKIFDKYIVSEDSLVITTSDSHLHFAALIAEKLKLKQAERFNLATARLFSNKILQRKLLKDQSPDITVEFKKVRSFHNAYLFARKFGYPLVAKPASLAGSRLVTFSNNLEELVKNVSILLEEGEEIYKKTKTYKSPSFLVEQYIGGKLYSIDSYVDEKGGVFHTPPCREFLPEELGFPNGYGLPMAGYLDDYTLEEKNRIEEVATKAIKATGIRSNVIHTEIKIDKDNCKIIELNSRMGGVRAEMLELSYNIDHIRHFIECISNQPLTYETPSKHLQYCVRINVYSPYEGYLKSMNWVEDIHSWSELKAYKSTVQLGTRVGSAQDGYSVVCRVILASTNKEALINKAKQIPNLLDLEVSDTPLDSLELDTGN